MRNLKLTDNPGSAPKICSELEFQTQSGPSISLDANFASGKSPGTSSSVQSLSRVQLFATPWTAAHQASLSITHSQSLLKLMPLETVMPSNHLILCRPLPLPPSIFRSIKVFQMSQFFASGGQSIGVSASASVLPMNIQDWFLLGWTGWISLQSKRLSRVFSNTRAQKHQFFGAQLFYSPTLTSIQDYWKNHSFD